MRGMGACDADVAKAKEKWLASLPEQPLMEVFPENIGAFRVLVACADQWESPGLHGGRLAVPLQDIDVAMRRLGLPDTEFMRVLVMVREARAVKLEQLEQARAAAEAQRSRR